MYKPATKPTGLRSHCQQRFIHDQRGAIAIAFVIMMPLLLALIALWFDKTRYIAQRARLSDALEQAALALTAENNGDATLEARTRNADLVTQYVQAYMRDAASIAAPQIIVSYPQQHVDYQISITTQHNSWFSSPFFTIFSERVDINDSGAAQREIGQANTTVLSNMDVVFAADFSGSMANSFSELKGSTKLGELTRILLELAEKIYSRGEKNRVGFVPFAWGTRSLDGKYCTPQLELDISSLEIQKKKISKLRGRIDIQEDKIPYIFWLTKFIEEHISYKTTVDNISRPDDDNQNKVPIFRFNYKDGNACLAAGTQSIELTTDAEDLEKITTMTAQGKTFISSGVLAGAQMLSQSQANKKVLIIITDGQDTTYDKTSQKLIEAGMCKKIKTDLSIEMAFVAITGDKPDPVGNKPNLVSNKPDSVWEKQCIDQGHYYTANNVEGLEEKLHQAVTEATVENYNEEVGRNRVK